MAATPFGGEDEIHFMSMQDDHPSFPGDDEGGRQHHVAYCGARCLGRGLISHGVNIEHAVNMGDFAIEHLGTHPKSGFPQGGAIFGRPHRPTQEYVNAAGRRCASCGRDLAPLARS